MWSGSATSLIEHRLAFGHDRYDILGSPIGLGKLPGLPHERLLPISGRITSRQRVARDTFSPRLRD